MSRRMSRTTLFFYAIAGWLGAEFVAFVMVAEAVGFGGAIILGCASSLIGFALLRESGAGALAQLQRRWAGLARDTKGVSGAPAGLIDELLRGLAALLLILPGFLSDLAGLALAAPSIRHFVAKRFGGAEIFASPRNRGPEIVDLAPGEWIAHDAKPEAARR